jgi:hypothetical protein
MTSSLLLSMRVRICSSVVLEARARDRVYR